MAPSPKPIAIMAAVSVALCSLYVLTIRRRAATRSKVKTLTENKPERTGIVGAIGNTPLIRIDSLSDATGCEFFRKTEFLNPGGSVKDRVAVKIIEEALESGQLSRGGVVTEGSAGSTSISLATIAPAYECKCHMVIPDDGAIEKSQILEALGATVERVRSVSITHKDHYVNIARRRASEANKLALKHINQMDAKDVDRPNGKETRYPVFSGEHKGGFFANQFENLANYRAHYEGTGPEIWEQTDGQLHAFVAAAGTSGTIAGVSCFLKEKDLGIKCFLVDPPGSVCSTKLREE